VCELDDQPAPFDLNGGEHGGRAGAKDDRPSDGDESAQLVDWPRQQLFCRKAFDEHACHADRGYTNTSCLRRSG
jgi:hypothetical protein